MAKEIQVLWLDDAFTDSQSTETKLEKQFEDALSSEKLYSNVNFTKVTTSKEFIAILDEMEDAISIAILDIEGLKSADDNRSSVSTNAFFQALKRLQDTDISVIIFSGNIDEGCREFNLLGQFEENHWPAISKQDLNRKSKMLEAIKDAISKAPFKGFEYLQDIAANHLKGVAGVKESFVQILEAYTTGVFDHKDLNVMRTILEKGVFIDFISCFNVSAINNLKVKIGNDKQSDFSKGNPTKDLITKLCPKDYSGRFIQFDKPFVSFDCCPQEVKHALEFLWEYTNIKSHDLAMSSEFRSYFGKHVKNGAVKMGYEAFFLVMRWFSVFMNNPEYKRKLELEWTK